MRVLALLFLMSAQEGQECSAYGRRQVQGLDYEKMKYFCLPQQLIIMHCPNMCRVIGTVCYDIMFTLM